MAKIKSKIFRFTPSASPDVVGYRVYVDLPGALTYSSPSHTELNPTPDADGKVAVDLANLSISATKDGIYDIGVAALDDADNESDMATLAGVNLDFIAPDAPTNLEIV